MDENDSCTHLFFRLISFQMTVSKSLALHIAMRQVEAELRLPHIQKSKSGGYAAPTHIANCPSNVGWRRLQTVGRFLYTLTEHSSLWSMSLLSSTVRRSGQAVHNSSIIPHVGDSFLRALEKRTLVPV